MNELDKALDDLDGLQEAFRALHDAERSNTLRRSTKLAKAIGRDLAAGTDAYASTLISSPRGELDARRLRKCRSAALGRMPVATANQRRLASLVNERRMPNPAQRSDVQRLLSLSLHCRTALAALAPTVDRRAAEAIGNKVLVELRAATLLYLATARDAGDGSPDRPRSAVVDQLRKTEAHAHEFVRLDPSSGADSASLGATLSTNVVSMLHRTSLDWDVAQEQAPH